MKKADIKPGKVYVGKLPDSGLGEEDIKEHFSQYGAIAEVIRPIDKSKNNEPKNFCFVTFERERVAKKLIEEGSCIIGGHKMQIKQVIISRCFVNIFIRFILCSIEISRLHPTPGIPRREEVWVEVAEATGAAPG